MQTELVGYVSINTKQKEEIEAIVDELGLYTLDSHDSEVVVEVDKELIKRLKGKHLSKDDVKEIKKKGIEVIKFYT